ncbi:protein PAXX isoform X2 [Saccopteryx leptura]|uniref:protein PAXX isoform X2 n=1 Tax=Saccopteryx leptura TaxID=249018 RepID=UPI00339BA6E9
MVPPPPAPPLSPPLCTLPPGPGPPRYVCYCEEEGIGAEGQGGFSLHVTDAVELWSTCLTPDSLAALVESPFRPECDGGHHSLVQGDGASLTLSGGLSAPDFELSKVSGPEAASRLQALTLSLAERVCSLERRLAGRVGGRGTLRPRWGPPAFASIPGFPPQLQRRQLPAPGRALGKRGFSPSYQVMPLAYDLSWGCAQSSVAQFPQNKPQAPERGSVWRGWGVCGPGSYWIQVVPSPTPILLSLDPDPQRGCPGPGVRRRCPGESLINPGFKSKKPASGVDFDDL